MTTLSKYEHVISLGSFCSTAEELRRYGLRDATYPFDWVILGVEPLIKMIETRFEGFLAADAVAVHPAFGHVIRDSGAEIDMYHDFDSGADLRGQLPAVRKKYARRISRFYEAASSPTLFVLYLLDELESSNLDHNVAKLLNVLRELNPGNDLILVANFGAPQVCGGQRVYLVAPDEGDAVARRFLDKNRSLRRRLLFVSYPMGRRARNYIHHVGNRLPTRTSVVRRIAVKLGLARARGTR